LLFASGCSIGGDRAALIRTPELRAGAATRLVAPVFLRLRVSNTWHMLKYNTEVSDAALSALHNYVSKAWDEFQKSWKETAYNM
jgi:hypothetical protein